MVDLGVMSRRQTQLVPYFLRVNLGFLTATGSWGRQQQEEDDKDDDDGIDRFFLAAAAAAELGRCANAGQPGT